MLILNSHRGGTAGERVDTEEGSFEHPGLLRVQRDVVQRALPEVRHQTGMFYWKLYNLANCSKKLLVKKVKRNLFLTCYCYCVFSVIDIGNYFCVFSVMSYNVLCQSRYINNIGRFI